MNAPCRAVGEVPVGRVLHTLCWTSHLDGTSTKIELVQAARRNQVVVRTWGRESAPHGVDWFARRLRSRLKVQWMSLEG
jgi:hypothetical protein